MPAGVTDLQTGPRSTTKLRRWKLFAGTPPGGGQDRAARALSAALDIPVDVINLAGRGGGNAWDALARRHGDGTALAISSPTLITNKMLGVADVDHRDLTPVAQLCTEYLAFAVNGTAPAPSPPELARGLAGGELSVALAVARGNVNHLALGSIVTEAGGDPRFTEPRVFDSARYAVRELLEGRVDLAVVTAASLAAEVIDGSVSVVATTSAERLSGPFEAVPTWLESGFTTTIGTWRGLVAGPRTRRRRGRSRRRAHRRSSRQPPVGCSGGPPRVDIHVPGNIGDGAIPRTAA